MTDECTSKGCVKPATCCPRLCFPAIGENIATSKPISIVMGFGLCDEHLAAFDLQKVLTADGRAMFRHKIAGKGKREPDFDRAFVVACRFDSPDYIMMKATRLPRVLGAIGGSI